MARILLFQFKKWVGPADWLLIIVFIVDALVGQYGTKYSILLIKIITIDLVNKTTKL